ncbi:MAG: putative Ig domain-containing protein [Acidobacteria bacterium]|nr:putative Ig domain-containing protein [Acidobacteriota bacterium]
MVSSEEWKNHAAIRIAIPAGTVTAAYPTTTVTATGGSGSYSWPATGLPPGLSIHPSTGLISGTPSSGTGSPVGVNVSVTDSAFGTATPATQSSAYRATSAAAASSGAYARHNAEPRRHLRRPPDSGAQSFRSSFSVAMSLPALFLLVLTVSAQDATTLMERQILEEVNRERRSRGLNKLEWDDRVAGAARNHSRNMARRKFFSHEDPVAGDMRKRLRAAGVEWTACAENLYEESRVASARSVVRAWMNSAGHRQNLLNGRYTHTGVGVRVEGRTIVTELFVTKPHR